eukprot:scaffold102680_cov33-Tisochrysis_lutea.AAC.4
MSSFRWTRAPPIKLICEGRAPSKVDHRLVSAKDEHKWGIMLTETASAPSVNCGHGSRCGKGTGLELTKGHRALSLLQQASAQAPFPLILRPYAARTIASTTSAAAATTRRGANNPKIHNIRRRGDNKARVEGSSSTRRPPTA